MSFGSLTKNIKPTMPDFFVLARVVGSDGAFPKVCPVLLICEEWG
jgi:hypothetical protein